MLDKLRLGQLKDAILNALKASKEPLSAMNLINAIALYDVHTTDDSIMVTLSRMHSSGKIKRDTRHCCKECGRKVNVYYV